jgi:hypothetical protein
MATLTATTLHLTHHDALHTDAGDRIADLIELEGFDNGYDQFHFSPLARPTRAGCRESPFKRCAKNLAPPQNVDY